MLEGDLTLQRRQHGFADKFSSRASTLNAVPCWSSMIADVGAIGVDLRVFRSMLVEAGQAFVNPLPVIMPPPDGPPDKRAVN
jgi:hypothetical protein